MTQGGNASRRGFLKGGLVAGAASFVDFGPLSKLNASQPPLKLVSERSVPIPQVVKGSVEVAQRELSRMGFSVPLRSATQYKVRTPDGRKTMTHFTSESLERSDQRATISAAVSKPLTAVTATVATWDGVHLTSLEIFEVQGSGLRSLVKASLRDDKVVDLQNYGASEAEVEGLVGFLEKSQELHLEYQKTGASCCSCIGAWGAIQFLVCGTIALAACWAFGWPWGLICGLIFSYVCYYITLSCEDKCQLCRAECPGPLSCYGCC